MRYHSAQANGNVDPEGARIYEVAKRLKVVDLAPARTKRAQSTDGTLIAAVEKWLRFCKRCLGHLVRVQSDGHAVRALIVLHNPTELGATVPQIAAPDIPAPSRDG